MAMDRSRILGFGADQPLVDLEGDDEVGAAARTPAPTARASSTSTPSPRFVDTILGLAPDEGRDFRRSLAGGLNAAVQNYDKPAWPPPWPDSAGRSAARRTTAKSPCSTAPSGRTRSATSTNCGAPWRNCAK